MTDHFDRFVKAGIRSGRFSDASEAVREGLRLLEQRDKEDKAKIEWLRAAAKGGFDQLDRGEGIELASEEDLDEFFEEITKKAPAQLVAGRKRA